MRSILKQIIAASFYYSGALFLFNLFMRWILRRDSYAILMYHNVISDQDKNRALIQPGMCVTRTFFERQIEILKNNYHVISLQSLTELLRDNKPIPHKAVVITFDDGWRDNYEIAYPIMRKFNIPATIFLPTDLIETQKLPIFIEASLLLAEGDLWPEKAMRIFAKIVTENNLDSAVSRGDIPLSQIGGDAFKFMKTLMLLEYKYIGQIVDEFQRESGIDIDSWRSRRWMMNWDEIRIMNQNGIDFGSHGQSHDLMVNISEKQVADELAESKKIIESRLGKDIKLFSYPNGDYNEKIKNMVEMAGYWSATATSGRGPRSAKIDLFALRRLGLIDGAVSGPRGEFFAEHIQSLVDHIVV